MRREEGAEGSFTIEMAAIFPVILLMIFLLLQIGLSYSFRIMAHASATEALEVYGKARSASLSAEEAEALADEWLERSFGEMGDSEIGWYWESSGGLLSEEVSLVVSGEHRMIIALPFRLRVTKSVMDERRFRDRVDQICEIGRKNDGKEP